LPKSKKPKEDEQVRAFRKAARDLECDPDFEKFNAALKTIATAIGQDDPKKDFGKKKPIK